MILSIDPSRVKLKMSRLIQRHQDEAQVKAAQQISDLIIQGSGIEINKSIPVWLHNPSSISSASGTSGESLTLGARV